jgi:hypothetical protein
MFRVPVPKSGDSRQVEYERETGADGQGAETATRCPSRQGLLERYRSKRREANQGRKPCVNPPVPPPESQQPRAQVKIGREMPISTEEPDGEPAAHDRVLPSCFDPWLAKTPAKNCMLFFVPDEITLNVIELHVILSIPKNGKLEIFLSNVPYRG